MSNIVFPLGIDSFEKIRTEAKKYSLLGRKAKKRLKGGVVSSKKEPAARSLRVGASC